MTHSGDSSPLFESISNDIVTKGYSIYSDALPKSLANLLLQHITELPEENFNEQVLVELKVMPLIILFARIIA